VVLANAAMNEVRRDEIRSSAAAVRAAVGAQSKKALRQLLWGMRKNPVAWTPSKLEAVRWLGRSNLKPPLVPTVAREYGCYRHVC